MDMNHTGRQEEAKAAKTGQCGCWEISTFFQGLEEDARQLINRYPVRPESRRGRKVSGEAGILFLHFSDVLVTHSMPFFTYS